MKMSRKKKAKKLPDMTDWTDEKIHEFWKTHDAADYWEEMKAVEVKAVRPQQRAVSVKLDERDIALLKAIAHEMGIGHTTLIRLWLKEKLKRPPASLKISPR